MSISPITDRAGIDAINVIPFPAMASIRKAVIPVAGFGTRMLPAAKSVPKELLPILNRPTIQYVVEEAVEAGIADALFITAREKRGIEDYFDRNAELSARLEKSGRSEMLASIDALMDRVTIHSVRQREAKGLGDAVLHAEQHVGNETFACLLGDTVFSGGATIKHGPMKQLCEAYDRVGTTIIGLVEIPAEQVKRYGIAGVEPLQDDLVRITSLVEKPSIQAAPSRLAIAARYVLTPKIFELLRQTTPGTGGEIQLTDALNRQLEDEPMHGVILKSKRHDIGNVADWLQTNLIFAARDESLWPTLRPMIEALLANDVK